MEKAMKTKWTYTRLSNGVSKWTTQDQSWVTKWDEDAFCYIGFCGTPKGRILLSPKLARKRIEDMALDLSMISSREHRQNGAARKGKVCAANTPGQMADGRGETFPLT